MPRTLSLVSLVTCFCLSASVAGQATMSVGEGQAHDDVRDYMTDTKTLGSTGVCCFGNGVCIEGLPDGGGDGGLVLAAACTALGGTWSTGTTCAAVCAGDGLRGCCFPDGNCVDLLPADCAAVGGQSDAAFLCDEIVCFDLRAVCCLDNGMCINVRPAVCNNALGGMPRPGFLCGGVVCPQPVACCIPCTGSCIEMATVADCAAAGGFDSGQGSCGAAGCPPPPPMGICCNPVAATLTCSQVTPCQCAIQGGTFLEGLTCSPDNPCIRGACCNECDGTCERVRPDECADSGGVFLGQGTICEETTCLFKGACCMPGNQCTDMTMETCADVGGSFDLSSTCATTSCEGACCFPGSGVCDIRIQTTCVFSGGVWQGAGTDCNAGCPATLLPGADGGEPTVPDILRAWGDCAKPCPEDVNRDGHVDTDDLVEVLQTTG